MPRYNTILSIDRSALVHNINVIRNQIGRGVQIGAVVKANGYGLGLETVIPIFDTAGADAFYVANIDEGMRARTVTEKPIFILGGFVDGDDVPGLAIHTLTPVVNTTEQLDLIRARGADLPFSLHLDTAMNRLGLSSDDVQKIITNPDQLRGLNMVQIMSHFASSDEKDSPLNQMQSDRFEKSVRDLRTALGVNTPASLANSSGVFRSPTYHHHMVRPGFSLYGGNPTPETSNPMRPVIRLQSRILQIRTAKRGETVGYNATHTFDRDTTLMTIGTGYADGLLRSLSNRGKFYWGDIPCTVVGRVSMDLTSVALPPSYTGPLPKIGDLVDLIGPHQTIDDLAAQAGTIGYEILTQLSTRAERIVH